MERKNLGVLFLHALPLDGSMWAAFMDVLPGSTFAPTLYGLGNSLEVWAEQALRVAPPPRLVVVGCSVGGSCALEIAAAAPDRVEALVLIGTKADNRRDPDFRDAAIRLVETQGVEAAWNAYWATLFSDTVEARALQRAKRMALGLSPREISRGIAVFHDRPSRGAVAKNWRKPAIVVTGAHDTAPGVEASGALATAMPNSRLEIVQESGHYVPLEQPDALRSILVELIASV